MSASRNRDAIQKGAAAAAAATSMGTGRGETSVRDDGKLLKEEKRSRSKVAASPRLLAMSRRRHRSGITSPGIGGGDGGVDNATSGQRDKR